MVNSVTRRRFIQLAAVCGTVAALPLSAHALPASGFPIVRWKGRALGAEAQLTLVHPNKQRAEITIQHCIKEMDRLESIFSLYRPGSDLNQLNISGKLDNAPAELREVIRVAMQYGEQSDGAFDITIQPLWKLYHQHFTQSNPDPNGPSSDMIERTLQKVGYQKIDMSGRQIRVPQGTQITLNGIAQGYITDRITHLLKDNGFEQALVNLGEYQAIGQHPDGRAWNVAIPAASQPWKIHETLTIPPDKALASSGADGTRWSKKAHHLFSPKTGRSVNTHHGSVSVIADRAMQADAIATTLCLLPSAHLRKAFLQHYPAVDVKFWQG